MQVRGAPLIGVVGAFGLALLAQNIEAKSKKEFLERIKKEHSISLTRDQQHIILNIV